MLFGKPKLPEAERRQKVEEIESSSTRARTRRRWP